MLRHKGDPPTTDTDTNFSAVHRERGEDRDHYMSQNPTHPSDRAASTDPHLRAIEIRTDVSQASWT